MDAQRDELVMAPNMTIENARPILKRKTTDSDQVKPHILPELTDGQQKRAKLDGSLVELKGRKLVFRQEAAVRSTASRRPFIEFEQYLLDAEEAGNKISEIPEVHLKAVVLAGHESSARTEALFHKHLKSVLKITSEAVLPNDTLSAVTHLLFNAQDYGFQITDFSASSSSTSKLPVSLQIRCWEAKELEKYFSAEQCTELRARKEERTRARMECLRLLEGMDDVEKMELLKGDKGDDRMKAAKRTVDESPKTEVKRMSREGTAHTTESRRSGSPVKKGKLTPEEEEASRIRKGDREAKRAARADEKAIKEKEEERKKAIMAKQAQKMSSFFKAKPLATPPRPISRESPAGPSSLRHREAVVASDFQKAFKPVAQRPMVEWAAINRWVKPRCRSQSRDEGGGKGDQLEVNSPASNSIHVATLAWESGDFLNDHLRKHGFHTRPPRKYLPFGLKTASPYGTVLDVWTAHQEALDPRKVLGQLQDRHKFPWKTLAFDQQTRPPYSGTFTKKSVTVGPRTPFAQDATLDYSYDSGDEWQEDEGGDDVDDFDELAGQDEEVEEDASEGEFDDWLDDTEDLPFVPVESDEDPSMSLPSPALMLDQTCLPMKVVKKTRETPKRVIKIAPYWKGPLWERKIGEGNDGMEGYRLQLLNDTPSSIDPFTYASSDPTQRLKATFSTVIIGTNLDVRCLLSTEEMITVKDPSDGITHAVLPACTSLPKAENPMQLKPRPAGPKVAFPPSHLPELLRLIDGNTKIRTDLVSQLKAHFDAVTSKAAIEAKIREVAARQGKAKDSQWRVLPEAWQAAAGLPPPGTDVTAIDV